MNTKSYGTYFHLKLRIIAFISQKAFTQKYHKGNWQVTSLFIVKTIVYCQNLAFINYRHVYGSRISFSYLRNLPNSAPQWEHLCTQSLALGTQKGMAKHPSHNLQRILNYQVLKRKILNDKILIHVVITWKHLTKKKIMRVKQQITHFNLIGSPFKSGFLSKHCGPNVKVQKK